jgi:hypothetical protein
VLGTGEEKGRGTPFAATGGIMRKLVTLCLVVAIAIGVVALATSPAEAKKPPKDCSKQCPDIGLCHAVACGFDCVYECPFPILPPG